MVTLSKLVRGFLNLNFRLCNVERHRFSELYNWRFYLKDVYSEGIYSFKFSDNYNYNLPNALYQNNLFFIINK